MKKTLTVAAILAFLVASSLIYKTMLGSQSLIGAQAASTQGILQSLLGMWTITRDTKRDCSLAISGEKVNFQVTEVKTIGFMGKIQNSSSVAGTVYSPESKMIITFTETSSITGSNSSVYRVYVGKQIGSSNTIAGTWYGTGGNAGEEGEFVMKK